MVPAVMSKPRGKGGSEFQTGIGTPSETETQGDATGTAGTGTRVFCGTGSSVRDAGKTVEKRRPGRVVRGLGAGLVGLLLTFGSAGCGDNTPTQNPDSGAKARVQNVLKMKRAEHIKMSEAAKVQAKTVLSLGGMPISPGEEPVWHKMVREDAAGMANHSQKQIQDAMADSLIDFYERHSNPKGVSDARQNDIDSVNIKLLEKHMDVGMRKAVEKAYE